MERTINEELYKKVITMNGGIIENDETSSVDRRYDVVFKKISESALAYRADKNAVLKPTKTGIFSMDFAMINHRNNDMVIPVINSVKKLIRNNFQNRYINEESYNKMFADIEEEMNCYVFDQHDEYNPLTVVLQGLIDMTNKYGLDCSCDCNERM